MRVFIISLFFIFSFSLISTGNIVFDAVNKNIQLQNFYLPINIEGDVFFNIKQQRDCFVLNLEAKDLIIDEKLLSWVRLRLIKKENEVFIDNFSLPYLILKGRFNLITGDIFFDINANYKSTDLLTGQVQMNTKAWGRLDNFIISGYLNIFNGEYKAIKFERIFLNFFGSFPTLFLTDSYIILSDKSNYKIEGRLNIGNFKNLFSDIQFVMEKFFLGDWKLISQDFGKIGLSKNVDEKFSILFDNPQSDLSIKEGTELNYKLQDDNYLKIRMESDKSILGFEVRKEF
ncbi:MAG: hypothetical protein NC935_02460 [Candidatus Omnitrophica bacterium]|nr:hypothetical protein [Candidatus Omnitrophota bacterium]